MPKWLLKQLNQAFKAKDRRQIRYLNECWISFQKKIGNKSLVKNKKMSKTK